MRKRRLVKTQLFLLIVTVGLIVWRMNTDIDKSDGFVSFTHLTVRHLYQEHFQVSDTLMVSIEAKAAFENETASQELVVYPWIVNQSNHTVVWQMDPNASTRDGVQASVQDSVQLVPGVYTAYYTTYGPTRASSRGGAFLGLKPHWTNDPGFWKLTLSAASGQQFVTILKDAPQSSNVVEGLSEMWSFEPSYSRQSSNRVFRVKTATPIRATGTAAICSSRCDDVRIYSIPSEVSVWSLSEDMTIPAGGAGTNRSFDLNIELDAGLYRIEYTVGSDQVSRSWQSNPPTFPSEWRTTFYTSDENNIFEFDPWATEAPLISLLEVRDSERLSVTLELDKQLTVVVFAMGEVRSSDSKYDYGWIEKEGRGARVWEMSYEKSIPAGGDETNRQEMGIITLEPGRYFVKYESDGSHSYRSWNKAGPDNGERWGIALFALNPDEVDSSVRVVETPQAWTTDAAPSEATVVTGDSILIRNRLGDDAHINERFVLSEATALHIVAMGEITGSSKYDFGWIERVSDGEKVWEMTYQNTTSAGGADRNRRFSGTLSLEPGEYRAYFDTDFSHSYGNFDDDQPSNGQDWGIAIYKVGQ
ncbi:hypothetical protein HQ496_08785 [bacterium]|nr:hypothetical protein [bacterium]